jgi:type IV pilus assembly protein PilV
MRTNRTITQSHARPAPRRRNRGSALIEAVVALVLFSAGIVGLIGLQARMVTAQSDAKYRADAVYLVSELVGAMWADRPNLASYATALPSGSAAVTVNNGIVTVTLTWTPPNYGTHTYSASTAIRF